MANEFGEFTPEYRAALVANADRWVPACGGIEQPFTIEGRRLLYCWNPQQSRHAYIDLGTDLEVQGDELPLSLRYYTKHVS